VKGSTKPRNDLEQRLFEIWAGVVEHSSFGVTDHFYEIGGDSLRAVLVITQIETEFGVNLPPTQLYHTPTIERLAEVIQGARSEAIPEQAQVPIFEMRAGRFGAPLFCFPGSGGNVSSFLALGEKLRPEEGIHVVLYSALERETPPSSLEELAASCLKGIKAIQPDGPYYLGGHSFGGCVAYEVAQQLRAAGEEVAMLALWEADMVPDHGFLFRIGTLRNLLNVRAVTLPRRMKAAYLQRQFASGLRHFFGNGGGNAAEDVNRVALDKIFRFQICAVELHRHYKILPYDGHLTVYCAADGGRKGDVSYWMGLARRGFEVYSILGDHNSMLMEPNVSELAENLQCRLEESRARMGRS
jgi:thioesterase domain-containing protein/acyl carrier protein